MAMSSTCFMRLRSDSQLLKVAGSLLSLANLVSSSGFHVSVKTVIGNVELPTDKPFGEWEIPFKNGVEVFEPANEFSCLPSPKAEPVGFSFLVQTSIGDYCFALESV